MAVFNEVNTRLKKAVVIAAWLLAAYAGSYAWLSEYGQYEVTGYSLGGSIGLMWAPKGFHQGTMKWNRGLMFSYWPLLFLDTRFWHRNLWADDTTKYRVNERDVQLIQDEIIEIREHLAKKSATPAP